jgi:hypothetical protein
MKTHKAGLGPPRTEIVKTQKRCLDMQLCPWLGKTHGTFSWFHSHIQGALLFSFYIGNLFWDMLGHGPWHDTPYIKLGTTLNMICSVTNSNCMPQY